MRNPLKRRYVGQFALGVCCAALGIIGNPVVAAYLSADGVLETQTMLKILLFESLCIPFGLGTALYALRRPHSFVRTIDQISECVEVSLDRRMVGCRRVLEQRATALTHLVIVGLAIFFVFTLRDGHIWDGDESLYIMHARNLAEGRPYAETEFIPNAHNAIHPAAYPPGLPLLLAPLYGIVGVNLQHMKLVGIAAFILFLLVFARVARHFMSPATALAVTIGVGLNPYFWDFKDKIMSEFPFLLFCYTFLFLCVARNRMTARAQNWAALAAACALALAYSTRSAGVVLFPALFLSTLYDSRRLLNWGTAVLVLGVSLSLLLKFLFPNDMGTYVGYFQNFSLVTVLKDALDYRTAIDTFLWVDTRPGLSPPPEVIYGLTPLFVLSVLAGFVSKVRAQFSILEVFSVLYLLLLILFPIKFEGARYLLPLAPLLFLYAFYGARALGGTLGGQTASARLSAMLFGALLTLYALNYTLIFGPILYSETAPLSRELFQTITDQVPADAVVLARKPTIIALYTGRRAAVWPAKFTDDQFWRYMQDIGAKYIVHGPRRFGRSEPHFDAFIERNRAALSPVFTNRWFTLYRAP